MLEIAPEEDAEVVAAEEVAGIADLLAGDYQRTGQLLPQDLARITSKRALSAEQVDQLVAELAHRGIPLSDAEEPDDEEISRDTSLGISLPRLPILKPEETIRLSHSIRTWLRLKEEHQLSGQGVSPSLLVIMTEGENAWAKMIAHNVRLVVWIARKFKGRKLDTSDLIQEGMFGLFRAIERFDPGLGYKFSTYATWWIHQSIHRAIDNQERTIRIPVHRLEFIRRFRRMGARLRAEFGTEPSLSRIATALEWPLEFAAYIADLSSQRTIDLDAPVGEEDNATLGELLKDDQAPCPEQLAIDSELKNKMASTLASLTAREERILRLRFGFDHGKDHTLEEIGIMFGVTRERIRQIEEKALRKLRHPSRKRHLRSFLDQ